MRVIPNEATWIGFSTDRPVDLNAPTETELAGATDLTGFVISLTAQSQGNTVPTPSIDTLFETSIPGTSQASFQADMYRDSETDTAWDTLTRDLSGYFFISRFGGTGTDHMPVSGEKLEVWPVRITSRTASALASNTAQTFTCMAAVPEDPAEDAVVAAAPTVSRSSSSAPATSSS